MDKLTIKWIYVFFGTIGALLLAYFCYAISEGTGNEYIVASTSFVCFEFTIVPLIAIRHESNTLTANLKTLSTVMVLVMLISHFAFALTDAKMPYYIIINGILLIAYIIFYLKLSDKKDL